MSLAHSPIHIIDPSREFRPETVFADLSPKEHTKNTNKATEEFRNYEDNLQTTTVENTYKQMHINQCVKFVDDKIAKWGSLKKTEMTILDAVHMLDALVDESDPDTDLPNSVHAFQTAERIREKHPDKDWFHLTGLIHDLGKVLALWGEPQYCVVGDTFPVGCQFQPSIVFHQHFKDNPDTSNEAYRTKLGIYKEGCGLNKVKMSWGHDEYLFRVLTSNGSTLPKEGLYMIRYHSFYPWHASGDYKYLCSHEDEEMLPWVKEFNKFDLYSKGDDVPNIAELVPYYQGLIDKYCPGKLKW